MLFLVAGLLLLLLAGVMAYYYLAYVRHQESEQHTPTPTPTEHPYHAPLPNPNRGHDRPVVYYGSNYLTHGRMSHLDSFKVGKEGEDAVVDQLMGCLDSRWTIFRNVVLPDRGGDIDIVVVGPSGIYALEVKTYSGSFQVDKGYWYKERPDGSLYRVRSGPNGQVRDNAASLCNYLKQQGLQRGGYVRRAVVMGRDTEVEVVSSGTEIWNLANIAQHITEPLTGAHINDHTVNHIVSLLREIPPQRVTA